MIRIHLKTKNIVKWWRDTDAICTDGTIQINLKQKMSITMTWFFENALKQKQLKFNFEHLAEIWMVLEKILYNTRAESAFTELVRLFKTRFARFEISLTRSVKYHFQY